MRIGQRRSPRGSLILIFLTPLLLAGPIHLAAQLRPIEPTEWRVWSDGVELVGSGGAGVMRDIRASLAGTEGRLIEAGNLAVTWRSGRMAVEAGGTVRRIFRDEAVFAPPHGGAKELGTYRTDSGAWRIGTVVRLSPEASPLLALLRFGTILPTTDNEVGLDRDQTDFFTSLGVAGEPGRFLIAGELGLGIFGTRDEKFEQSDVVVYSARVERQWGAFVPMVTATGHFDLLEGWTIRGNEAIGEVRVGVRTGSTYWLGFEVLRGVTSFSPTSGVLVTVGSRH